MTFEEKYRNVLFHGQLIEFFIFLLNLNCKVFLNSSHSLFIKNFIGDTSKLERPALLINLKEIIKNLEFCRIEDYKVNLN